MKPVAFILLMSFGLLAPSLVSAQTWTLTGAPTKNWTAVASSADGSKLVTVAGSGGIYSSTNYGATWISNTAPNLNWLSVASSADGNRLVAVPFNTTPYTSTNLSTVWGDNNVLANDWHWVASSADGSRLIGAGNAGRLAISTNAGSSWIALTNAPTALWGGVASSADGSKLVAMIADTTSSGGFFTSTNFGTAWTTNKTMNKNWSSVASSADGNKLAAVWGGSSIFTSTDAGGSWSSNNISGQDFGSIASSADGSKLVAASTISVGAIYTSTNSGNTWSPTHLSQAGIWKAVASSADGNRLVAVANGGGIWTFQSTPNPQLKISLADTNAKLSWIVPSTNFVLQQSADLVLWNDVTNPPTFNPTNLQNEINLPPTDTSGFYRLETP